MTTRITLDSNLVNDAKRVGRHKTQKEAAVAALREYVGRRKRLRMTELFGTIDFDPKYSYKDSRRAR